MIREHCTGRVPRRPGLSRYSIGATASGLPLAQTYRGRVVDGCLFFKERLVHINTQLTIPGRGITNPYAQVPPGPNAPAVVHAIVEIPKGRRSKFEIDKETGLLRLDRYLYSSLHYPGDYGFIPQTLAEDGDPLDILVMVNEATFSGCLIEARPIGLFKMTDRGQNDYKILAVPSSDPIFHDFHDLWRVPPHFLREVEHFFATYKELEGEQGEDVVQTQGWEDAGSARMEVDAAIKRYQDHEAKLNAESQKTAPATGTASGKSSKPRSPRKKPVSKKPTKKPSKPTTPPASKKK